MTIDERIQMSELLDQYGGLLTQVQKQTLQLYLIEDLSLGEIADVLATSRQAVNDAIRKAKVKLLKISESVQ